MNYKKILNMVIDDFVGAKVKNKPSTISTGKYEDKLVVIDKGFRLFILPPHLYPFDTSKLVNSNVIDVTPIVGKLDDYVDAKLTGELCTAKVGKVAKIANLDAEAWVNEKYLPEYGKDVSFKLNKEKSHIRPILVFKKEELVGVVMPVNMKKEL